MGKYLFSKKCGFTLVEVILTVFLMAFIVSTSYAIFYVISDQRKAAIERMKLDCELHSLVEVIVSDLSCAVLLNKDFVCVEIGGDENSMDVLFFSTNNDEHVTKAVKYSLTNIKDGRKIFTKYELSSSDSLLLQSALDECSLGEAFLEYKPESKIVLCSNVFDFKIRLASKTPSGKIFISPPNLKLSYKNGAIFYKQLDKAMNVMGTLAFADVSVYALSESANVKFFDKKSSLKFDKGAFLLSHLRKNFRRMLFKSSCF